MIEGLRLRLQAHLKTRGDLPRATVAFRAFYRLMEHRAGRPDYPEPVTWSRIESWINGTITEGGERPRPPEPDEAEDIRKVIEALEERLEELEEAT